MSLSGGKENIGLPNLNMSQDSQLEESQRTDWVQCTPETLSVTRLRVASAQA
jgi:hypothetical protein